MSNFGEFLISSRALGLLALQATALLAAAQLASWALHRRSAALRHRIWTLAMLGLLVLPALSRCTPTLLTVNVPSTATTPVVLAPIDSRDPTIDEMTPQLDEELATTAETISPEESASWQLANMPAGALEQPPTQQPMAARRAWLMWPLLWSAGACVCLLGLAISGWRGRRLVGTTTPLAWPELQSQCNELAAQLGIHRTIQLREHAGEIVPLTCGIWRPVIALPSAVHDWSAARRRMVLLHELGHIRRHDVAWQWLGQVACALYWFHPLAWQGLRQLRRESEQACDDLVLSCGERASDYADELVAIARLFQSWSWAQVVAMARRGSLEGRLRSLLDTDVARSHAPLKRRSSWLLLGAALLGTAFVSAVRLAGQAPGEAPPMAEDSGPPVDDEPSVIFGDDSTPPRTATVLDYAVLVVDSQDRPVVGARLIPWGIGTTDGTGWAWMPGWPKEFLSNEEGVVRILLSAEQLAVVSPEHGDFTFLSFRVEHPGFAFTARSFRLLSENEAIVLAEGFVVVPQAVDAQTGMPLTEDLFAYSSGAAPDAWLNEAGELRSPRLDAQSKESGRYFRIIYAPGESPEASALFSEVIDIRDLEPQDGVASPEIPLQAGVRLSGQLQADVPRPIRNGRVLLHILNDSDEQLQEERSHEDHLLWIDEAEINAEGEFEFPYVPRHSNVELLALCDGWVSSLSSEDAATYDAEHGTNFQEQAGDGRAVSTPVRVEQDPVQATLSMVQTGVCEVRVVDEAGEPVDRAVVSLWPNQRFRIGSMILGSGGSMLQNLRSGQSFATFDRENEDTARFMRVTDPQGRATIQGALVGQEMVNLEYPGYTLVPSPRIRSNFPYGLVDVQAGAAKVQVLRLQRQTALPYPLPARFQAAAEDGRFQFRLLVVDPAGVPLPGARVRMRGQDLQQSGARQAWPDDWMSEYTTNAAGFVLIDVPLAPATNLPALGECSFWLDVEHDSYASVSDYACSLSRPLPVRLSARDAPQ